MKTRLCIIYPNKSSSSETFIQAHVNKLPFDIKVLYGGWFPTYDGNDKPLNEFISLSVAEKILFRLRPTQQSHLKERALEDFLTKNKIDVVMVEYGITGTRVMNVCERKKIPLVVHFHGFDVYAKSVVAEYKSAYRILFQKASGLVVVSNDMQKELIRLGAPAEKITYNPCGVDVNAFVPSTNKKEKPIFLYVGRFVNKKGPQITIMAFGKVLKEVPDAKLIMVGDGGLGSAGELFEGCKQIVKTLKMEDNVVFKGTLTNTEVAEEMQNANIFVQHSVRPETGDSEGTPVTILEACAAGLAVISTRHGGISDVVIDKETGLLVDEYDFEGTVHNMVRVAKDLDYAERLGRAARLRVKNLFSMDRSIETLAGVISRAAELQRTTSTNN